MKNDETFNYYVQDYFVNYLPNVRNSSSNTIETYKYCFIDLLNFFKCINVNSDNLKIKDFKIEYIEGFIKYLKEKKNSTNTINIKIISIKSFFNYLNYKSIYYLDICSQISKIKMLKKDVIIPKYLSENEIELILNYTYDNDLIGLKKYVIFLLLYYGALRVNELCNLKLNDIEILDKSNYRIKIYNSKNNKNRVINFECNYGKYINYYLNKINQKETSYLFVNKYGCQYTKKGINYIINKIYNIAKSKNKNGVMFLEENIHPHMLRHSRAMHMLKSGVSLSEIKQYLGHSYIATTEIYARIDSSLIKDTIINHAKNINVKSKYNKENKEKLEEWLKTL